MSRRCNPVALRAALKAQVVATSKAEPGEGAPLASDYFALRALLVDSPRAARPAEGESDVVADA